MDEKNFITFIDLGKHTVKAGSYNYETKKIESIQEIKADDNFLTKDNTFIENIVFEIEKKNKEYLKEIYLMIDHLNILTVNILNFKTNDKDLLNNDFIQNIKDETKLQVIQNYSDYEIIHSIIKNYSADEKQYYEFSKNLKSKKFGINFLFLLYPKNILNKIREKFAEQNVFIRQFFVSSYSKSLFYLKEIANFKNVVFVDIGYQRTTTLLFKDGKLENLEILPIGGNHITKDISKILNINLIDAEKLKLNLNELNILNDLEQEESELIKKIIFSRTEELLEKSTEIKEIEHSSNDLKLVFFGNGSKILDNKFNSKIVFDKNINLIEENYDENFLSALNLLEVETDIERDKIKKNKLNKGFFEKFFNFFD